MTSETPTDGTKRPDDWPEKFASPALNCNHLFHWDTAVHVYYCLFCEAEREQPPEKYSTDTEREQEGDR